MINKTKLSAWIEVASSALDGQPFGFQSAHLDDIDEDYSGTVDVPGCLSLIQVLDQSMASSELRYALVVPLTDVEDPLGPLPSLDEAIREQDTREPPGVYLLGVLNGLSVVGDAVLRELDALHMRSGITVDVRLCLDKQDGDDAWSRYVQFKRQRRDDPWKTAGDPSRRP